MQMQHLVAVMVAVCGCLAQTSQAFVVPSLSTSAIRKVEVGSLEQQQQHQQQENRQGRAAVHQLRVTPKGKEEEEEQSVTDLNLEQMFEVFEAADKEIPDEKGAKKTEGKESNPLGDMMEGLFGKKK